MKIDILREVRFTPLDIEMPPGIEVLVTPKSRGHCVFVGIDSDIVELDEDQACALATMIAAAAKELERGVK